MTAAPRRLALPGALLLVAASAHGANPVTTIDLLTQSTASNLRRVYGSAGNGGKGVPVAIGPDCDGDGIRDYGMAAMTASPFGRSGAGEVYLIFGDGGVSGTIDTAVAQAGVLKIAGDQNSEATGDEIWIDDVTGDGIGDLIIGRQNHTPGVGRTGAGALTIIAGGPFLRQHAATLQYFDLRSPPAGSSVTTIVGASACDRLGVWMRTGDVTGDGIADIVVGADQEEQSGETHAGALYVIRGGPHLFANQTIDLQNFGAATLPGNIARIVPPPNSTHFHFGATVQIADLDKNGRAEVLMAAALNRAGATIQPSPSSACSTHGSGGSARGTLYIAWDDNFPATPWPNGYTFDIAASPGSRSIISGGAAVAGRVRNFEFGEEILGGLDYDNDGNADLFVGDLTANIDEGTPNARNAAGSGHVLYSAASLKNKTFNLDNLPAGIVMSTFLGGAGVDILADTALDGDFDGDGIADLAFSSPLADPFGRTNAGTLHVFHGQNGVWPALIDLKPGNLPPAASIRITEIYGAKGTVGADQGDTLAYSASAGDADGDGRTDLVTNEMLGNGLTPATVDAGNLIILSGALIDSTTGATLRGTVRHAVSMLSVPAARVDLLATPARDTHSNAAGRYGFPELGAGNVQVLPSRNGGSLAAVDDADAILALKAVVGTAALDANRRMACDVTANGMLTALDAARIHQFRAGTLARFASANACQSDWLFWPSATALANQTLTSPSLSAGSCTPGRIAFGPLDPPVDNRNFDALLIGDCNASWAP
jgi:hypothetical protein